ncbi:uncharacterized protein DNG_02449 [Cephalotrichum gorgonifer]|uniref:Uncharacterized protein n=1 Tax=Cephalotrichum gorgonifer TaxID=2041049 RepID=A0AAE8MSF3_9PEZI|nr:uncharacterized protein DNG_02449 [Cephalotrichum gorgonifer]
MPRATDSLASRPASFHTGGSSPQSPGTEPVPEAPLRVWMREGESDTAQDSALSPSSHSSLSNPLVLEQSAESAEPVTAPESPTEPSDMDCDASVGDDPQHSDPGLHLKEDNESLRAVSHSSTVFFDAPGSLASRLGSFMSDIEEQPPTADVVVLPTTDAKDGRSPERQPAFSQARLALEPGRDVSSNYSASGMLSSTASPTTPRSPVISPERLREELPYEVDTLRQRLFSHYPSGVFGSSTWEQSEDLDLTSLGRLSVENTSVEGRVRLSSEELTVIQGSRSMSLESRPVSIRGSQTIPPSRSSTLRSGHMISPVPIATSMSGRWHDGPADASAAASETRTLGGQPSTTETCTITSTQAIKSRTFSSPSGSEISAAKASVDTSGATERSRSCEPLSPLDKGLSTICTPDAPVAEGMNNATGDTQTISTDTATSGNSAAGGVAGNDGYRRR